MRNPLPAKGSPEGQQFLYRQVFGLAGPDFSGGEVFSTEHRFPVSPMETSALFLPMLEEVCRSFLITAAGQFRIFTGFPLSISAPVALTNRPAEHSIKEQGNEKEFSDSAH